MQIALLQYPVAWADKAANLRFFGERLSEISGKADVAVLPEMFTTGFSTDHPELADPMDGEVVGSLMTWAQEYDLAIAGSFMCRVGDKLVNRGFFCKPDGSADWIDKRHLYAHGGEAAFFSPGKERVISEYKGVRFCLQVCYDLRFPVWVRNRTGYDYDILIYTAAWPEIRIGAWDILLRARAIENQCYLIGVNCVGDDGLGLHYSGHSVALDTRMQDLAGFAENESATRIVDFNIPALQHFREVLPLWKDADPFELKEEWE